MYYEYYNSILCFLQDTLIKKVIKILDSLNDVCTVYKYICYNKNIILNETKLFICLF